MTELPNRIRELRKARGWSLLQLGERAGCSLQMVGQLERGISVLTLPWMRVLGRALGVQPADLLLPEDNSFSLSADELLWLAALRNADDRTRRQLVHVRDTLMETLRAERQIRMSIDRPAREEARRA